MLIPIDTLLHDFLSMMMLKHYIMQSYVSMETISREHKIDQNDLDHKKMV